MSIMVVTVAWKWDYITIPRLIPTFNDTNSTSQHLEHTMMKMMMTYLKQIKQVK